MIKKESERGRTSKNIIKVGDVVAYNYWNDRSQITGTGMVTRIIKYLKVPPVQIKDDVTGEEIRVYHKEITNIKKSPSSPPIRHYPLRRKKKK